MKKLFIILIGLVLIYGFGVCTLLSAETFGFASNIPHYSFLKEVVSSNYILVIQGIISVIALCGYIYADLNEMEPKKRDAVLAKMKAETQTSKEFYKPILLGLFIFSCFALIYRCVPIFKSFLFKDNILNVVILMTISVALGYIITIKSEKRKKTKNLGRANLIAWRICFLLITITTISLALTILNNQETDIKLVATFIILSTLYYLYKKIIKLASSIQENLDKYHITTMDISTEFDKMLENMEED